MTRADLDKILWAHSALALAESKRSTDSIGLVDIEGNAAQLPSRYAQAARAAIRELALTDLALCGVVLEDAGG